MRDQQHKNVPERILTKHPKVYKVLQSCRFQNRTVQYLVADTAASNIHTVLQQVRRLVTITAIAKEIPPSHPRTHGPGSTPGPEV